MSSSVIRLEEDKLDVNIKEETVDVDIYIDNLEVDICEFSTSTTRCPDSLNVNIEEVTLDVSIVENVLSIQMQECMVIHDHAGLGKIKRTFDYNELSGNALSIGNIPAGSDVLYTILEIIEAFDGDVKFTVGTAASHALLMTLEENSPDIAGRYTMCNNLELPGTENFRIFPTLSNPVTQGSGRVTIYFH